MLILLIDLILCKDSNELRGKYSGEKNLKMSLWVTAFKVKECGLK